jgi:hypothetical protein
MKSLKKSQAKESTEKKKAGNRTPSFPLFCDFTCSYAQFAEPDAVGACRRELAVFCTKFNRHHNKNSTCIGRNT